MPIIPNIGRKSLKIRAVIILIYVLLITGTISMLYPFLLMLSGSVKGFADTGTMDPVPEFIFSDALQFARFQESRYQDMYVLSTAYGQRLYKFDQAEIPGEGDCREVESFRRFIKERIDSFPEHFYYAQEMVAQTRISPRNFRRFANQVQTECGSVEEFNRRYKGALASWNEFPSIVDVPHIREFSYDSTDPFVTRYLEFKSTLTPEDKVVINIDGLFANMQQNFEEIKTGKIQPLPILTAAPPADSSERAIWAKFVKTNLSALFVKLTPESTRMFQSYLAGLFPGGISEMNRIDKTSYPSFESVKATHDELRNSALFIHYSNFIKDRCPVEHLRVDSPSTRYREYISDVDAVAPIVAYDYQIFLKSRKPFMREMLTRNYISVIQYVAIHGRAVINTLIFIGLAILAALTVNPIAAYALSRFNLKNTYLILMFFLATMAFPGAVTMIPNFLLLKELGLLNTFWALVLPGVANGYFIFILKGFFDSIPREVYESAQIDGANEWTMFWRFTMALSKPILALMTLGAFTSAYTAFMFALIICPDERMWTLMVWLFQMQQGAAQPVVYAALVLAAIPTLGVFILAQNVIMRGIVIPVEK